MRGVEHTLDVTRATAVDVFSRDRPPVLTVSPGDALVVRTLDASGYLDRPRVLGERPPRLLPDSQGHCLTGPVAVHGAQPGDVLSVHLTSLVPGAWGWTVAGARDDALDRRLGLVAGEVSWLLWDLDTARGTATESRGFRRRLAPFLGVIGLAPGEAGEHSTVPPRPGTGGNIDCRELVAGSTLHLPVEVEGALLSLGDGHAAQGDGEVDITALETALRGRLQLVVRKDMKLTWPRGETPTHWIAMGADSNLTTATKIAVREAIAFLASVKRMTREDAYMLVSTACDVRITQLVDGTMGAHVMIPKRIFTR